jgi:hypothetical protein
VIEMPLRIRYASIKAQHSAFYCGNHTFDRKRSVQRSVSVTVRLRMSVIVSRMQGD